MKDKIILALIFSLFVAVLVLATLYVDQTMKFPNVVLDNQTVNNMTKEEIIGFYKEREKMIENNKSFEILTLIVGVLGFMLGASTFYLISKEPTTKVDLDSIMKLAPENERDVIKILIEKGGEAAQHYIRTRLGINKVAMTRLIEKMEREGKIEVTRGRINYVRLSKDLKENFKKLGFNL